MATSEVCEWIRRSIERHQVRKKECSAVDFVSDSALDCCSECRLSVTGPENGRATVAHVCDGLLVRVVYHYYNSSEYKQTSTSHRNPRVITDQGQWISSKLTGDDGENNPLSISISTKQ